MFRWFLWFSASGRRAREGVSFAIVCSVVPPTLKVVEAAAAAALPSLTLSLGTRRQAQSRPAVYRTPEPSGRPHSWGAMRDLVPEGAETAVQPRTTSGEADQGPREPGAGAVSALRLVKRNHAMSCGTPRQTEATLCPRAGGSLPRLDLRPHHARGRLQTARSGASARPPRPGHGWQLCHAMLSRPPPPPRPAPHCPAARSAVSRCLGHLLGSLTQGRRANIAAECSAAARS